MLVRHDIIINQLHHSPDLSASTLAAVQLSVSRSSRKTVWSAVDDFATDAKTASSSTSVPSSSKTSRKRLLFVVAVEVVVVGVAAPDVV